MIIFSLFLGVGLRLLSLNQSLWLDEATSALATRMNLAQFFGQFMPGDFHPPLYYLTLRAWSFLFGGSEVALRSLSICFGIGTVFLVYLIGKKMIGEKAGIIGSLLLATSGLHIYYSQEARMYAMSTFLVALAFYLFMRIFFHKSRAGEWFLLALTIGAIGMTDYLPLLILIPMWILVIFGKKRFSFIGKFLTSHIILVFLGILWFSTFWKQLHAGISVTHNSLTWVSVLGTFSVKDIFLIPVKFIIGRVGFGNKFIYAIVVGLALLLVSYIFIKAVRQYEKVKPFLLWLVVPIGVSLVISLKIPILNYFRFLFVLPAFYLVIASGIVNSKKGLQEFFLLLMVFINLATSGMYLLNSKYQREDWRSTVNFIESNKSNGSEIVFSANSQMEAFKYYDPKASLLGPDGISKNVSEIWLVRYAQPIVDPTDSTRIKIEKDGFIKTKEYDFNGVVVWKYNMASPYAYRN